MYNFIKFIYNEYTGPYFLSHVVSKIFASAPPPTPRYEVCGGCCCLITCLESDTMFDCCVVR